MKNKIVALLLALSSLWQLTVAAVNMPESFSVDSAENGFISLEPETVDFHHSDTYIWGDVEPFRSYLSTELPAAYDAVSQNIVTPAKNQGRYGTCWAFATISAIETSMIKKGLISLEDADYSERHLAFFAHKKNAATGDGKDTYNSTYGYYGGGNQITAASHLAGWQGAELEENYPYSPYDAMADLTEAQRYSSYAHLQDFYILGADDVKSAILEYGSVICAYYDDDAYHTANAYYQNQKTNAKANHSVTIVGWDDNYALSNFDKLSEKPQKPGAWKIKNSWGSSRHDNGYFWISYEDTSLGDYVAVNAESTDNYRIINQYDGAAPGILSTKQKSANIFTANESQTVEAVGFYTDHGSAQNAPINYTIEVYLLNDEPLNPEDGTKLSTQKGTVYYDGYHTIELSSPVAVASKKQFSTVLTLKHPSGANAYHTFEGPSNASSVSGESFYYTTSWNIADSTSGYNNACIKAYSSVEDVTVTYDTNGGSDLSPISVAKYSLLSPPASPEKSGLYFAGWYKDQECSQLWDFDTDRAEADTTLYADWSESAIPVESISITGKSALYTGSSLTLTAKITPYYATDASVSWSSSDIGATVTNGVVTGVSKGTYSIRAECSNGISAEHSITVGNRVGAILFQTAYPVFKTSQTQYYRIYEPNAVYFEMYIQVPSGQTYLLSDLINDGSEKIFSISNFAYAEGEYRVYVAAYDCLGVCTLSNPIEFWVSDIPVLLGVSYPTSIKFGGFCGDSSSVIVLAYYTDGRLSKAETYTTEVFDTLKTIDYDYSYSELKIMWWNSLSGLTPATDTISFTEYTGTIKRAE